MEALRTKHPQAPPARPGLLQLEAPARALVPDLDLAQVVAAARSFKKGSAAGPSGLRGDHLREALAGAHCDEVGTHLTEVVQLLARGEGPSELAPHLASATLHALPKGADDLRPIAVGETLRRLVSKCLCKAVWEAARNHLVPLQVGVAAPLGAEAAVHTTRQWAQRHAGSATKVVVKLDCQNAFNMVDRGALLRMVRLHLPGLAPWAEWCYDRHSRLLFQGTPLTSEAGVQQGDPLGPLLFALALHPALQAAQASAPAQRLDLLHAFLDDVTLAGDYRHVASAVTRMAAAARQVGLQLRPDKCEIIACGGQTHAVDTQVFPAGFKVNASGSFHLLGAPIGCGPFCEQYTEEKRVGAARPLLQAIRSLPDAQTGLLLLRYCASFCKVVYSMRVTPPELVLQALQSFDAEVRTCLEEVGPGPLTAEAWDMAGLCTSAGGLGLRHASLHSGAAYVASVLATLPLCQALDPNYQAVWRPYQTALDTYNKQVLAPDRVVLPATAPCRQQKLSQALDRATLQQLDAPGPGRESFRAHLRLQQQPQAGAWLQAPPNDALGLHIQAPLFRVLLRLRLRLPVADEDAACPFCDGVADRFGDHSLCCTCGGDRVKRHNRLRSLLACRAQAAGLQTEVEKPGLLPPRVECDGAPEDGVRRPAGRRPADVWVGNWNMRGPAAFDLAVTSGMRARCLPASTTDAARPAEDYEARKRTHMNTQTVCAAEGLQFIPLVVEAGGGWAAAAMQTWKELGKLLAAKSGQSAEEETSQILQAFSVALQRENARMVLRRVGQPDRASPHLPDP